MAKGKHARHSLFCAVKPCTCGADGKKPKTLEQPWTLDQLGQLDGTEDNNE